MIKRMNQLRGQGIIEYTVMIIIILAVFLAMKNYVQRGVQGRWKASTDDLGDQYDPRTANTLINYVLNSTSNTFVDIVPATGGGFWTRRVDVSNSTETKGGQTSVGPLVNKL